VTNVLAIAQKELRSYFASPIAYIIIGFFALLFGFMYTSILDWFIRQGMQMSMMGMGPRNMNVNQQMIRPLFLNVSVLLLFILPFLTARSYAEEKRTGTVELLLTSPLTDLQIVMGKFAGAMALFGVLMAITALHIGLLFFFGTPEWRALLAGYLGIVLFGGCIVAIGLFISSLTQNQIIAGVATFAVILMLWVVDWLAESVGPRTGDVLRYLSMTAHLDDFVKGVVDTKHIVYYLSVIGFGLFLTVRSIDAERWRG